MLGKLLKYEFKATGRMLGVIYLAVLVVAAAAGLIGKFTDTNTNNPMAFMIILIVYGCLIIAMVIVTVLMIIERFYKNMLQGEGYLMHTLPVPTWMHVASKTISALVWEVLAVVVLAVSMFLCLAFGGVWKEIWGVWNLSEFQTFFEQNSGLVALTIVCMFVQLVRIILMFYTSMAIGGSATRHKLFYSLLTFIVIVIICSIINAICNMNQLTNLFHDTVGVYENSLWVKRCLRELITDIIYSGVFFGLTQVFLKRKLNLE